MISKKEEFEKFVIKNWIEINSFIDSLMENKEIPLYSSVDIRESKDKFAPVDNNLYPAGFNNLCNLDLQESSYFFKKFFKAFDAEIKSVGILVESNTKNTFYLDHLFALSQSLEEAGAEVKFISFDQHLFTDQEKLNLESKSKFPILIERAAVNGQKIYLQNNLNQPFDLIVLNNDQSAPIDINWSNISTPIHPSPLMGWFARHKINHFECYSEVLNIFCEKFEIERSLIEAAFLSIRDVDFSQKEGFDRIGDSVEKLKTKIGTDKKVFLKASKGTYGMGIHVVSSKDDVLQMNRKKRNKMDIGKNKIKFNDVLIQEGVDTVLSYDQMPAEVTIYLIGGRSVGGFMRANSKKSSQENLNSAGMIFKKFCIGEIRQNQDHTMKEAVYSTIARLSTLAAALETEKIKQGLTQ